jgi:hypothetical protein
VWRPGSDPSCCCSGGDRLHGQLVGHLLFGVLVAAGIGLVVESEVAAAGTFVVLVC